MMFVLVVPLAGIAVALIRRRLLIDPATLTGHDDTPARLLGWAVGLLVPLRAEWGQAMIGELDRLEGRSRRWRFALGCVGAALVLPPWGRAAAALAALMAAAAGAGGLVAYTHIHYRLVTDGWTWVGAAILVVFLVGYILGGSALLRRPGVAGPGLVGGLALTAAWLAVGGFTFNQWLNSIRPHSWLLLVILAPVVVGVGGTLWGGSAVIGRRAARLATVTAALSTYLYGVLAVAVIGAAGHDPSDGWTAAQVVADNLGNQAVFYLVTLPLLTATIGWAAAAATARLRYGGPAPALPHPAPFAPGPGPTPIGLSSVAEPYSGPTREGQPVSLRPTPGDGMPRAILAPTAHQRRTWYLLLLCAVLAAAAVLAFVGWLRP